MQTSYADGTAILKRKSMMQTQQFDDIHAVVASVGHAGHLDLLASFTHQQALMRSSQHHLDDIEEEPSDARRVEGDQPPGRDLPASYDSVGKPRAYASFRRKQDLPAITEQPDGDRQQTQLTAQGQGQGQGQGNSSYIQVRQSELQALIARHFMGHGAAQTEARDTAAALSSHTSRQDRDRATDRGRATDRARGAQDPEGSSSDDEADAPSPHLVPRSPHSPKAVRLVEAPQPAAPRTPPSSSPPKARRKRHNSDRVRGPRPHRSATHRHHDMCKSLEFLPDKGKPPQQQQQQQQHEELPPLQLSGAGSEERLPGVTAGQTLSGRQVTKVHPRLPAPDIYTISHKHPLAHSDA